jgi:hypothetical protein
MANRVLKLLIVGLLSLALVRAQEAKPLARHPGNVIKYQIKFDGPNADKINHVHGWLSSRVPVPKEQAGFINGFGVDGHMSSPKTFDLELKVPENIANGDYSLNFSASADEGSGNYTDGQEFNVPSIRIENPKTFVPPSVTVKELP